MDFKDEYKKEMTGLSSDETARRIREGVMAQLGRSANPETPVKKPLPIKRIALIGGSIAACLVIGFTAMIAARNPHLSGDMSPNAAAGMAGGATPSASNPNSIAAEGVNGMGGIDANQAPSGGLCDSGSDGSSTGYDPTNSAPENDQGTSMPVQADSEPRYPESNEPGMNAFVLITFEGDGFTLTDNIADMVTRFSPIESGDITDTYLSPDELRSHTSVYTADYEEYIVKDVPGYVILLNDELMILGRYEIVE